MFPFTWSGNLNGAKHFDTRTSSSVNSFVIFTCRLTDFLFGTNRTFNITIPRTCYTIAWQQIFCTVDLNFFLHFKIPLGWEIFGLLIWKNRIYIWRIPYPIWIPKIDALCFDDRIRHPWKINANNILISFTLNIFGQYFGLYGIAHTVWTIPQGVLNQNFSRWRIYNDWILGKLLVLNFWATEF